MPVFAVWAEGWKPHFCSNEDIVNEIKADWESRGHSGNFHAQELDNNVVSWDPGGMLMMDQEQFSFLLGDVVFKLDSQHFSQFIDWVGRNNYQPRGQNTKYIKLHGYWGCTCITPEEYERLLRAITDPTLLAKAESVYNERERRLNSLAKSGVIARVVGKDEDGQLMIANPDHLPGGDDPDPQLN